MMQITSYAHMFVSGICLYLSKHYSAVDSYSCTHFQSGCPNSSHISNKMFESKYSIFQMAKKIIPKKLNIKNYNYYKIKIVIL